MRQLGLLLLMIVLLIAAWTIIAPVHKPNATDLPGKHGATSSDPNVREAQKTVTFQEVSRKSQDALTTTAAYMQQEKDKLQVRMSGTLRKLDREIARLQAEANQAKAHDVKMPDRNNYQDKLQRRLVDLQGAKHSLLQMRSNLPSATKTAWSQIRTNWNRLEVDINARLQTAESDKAQAADSAHRG
jgi:hypothetical protein